MAKSKIVIFLLHWFAQRPLKTAHWWGAFLGHLIYLLNPKIRSVSAKNIQVCFPEYTIKQQQKLLKQSIVELGKTITEAGCLWFYPKNQIIDLVVETEGLELLRCDESQKGTILLIPHLGAWEMACIFVSIHYPMTSLYRPPKIQDLEQIIRQGRERFGANLVPTNQGGIKQLYQALKRGDTIALLPDQDPERSGGAFAPFFGVETHTMCLLSRLAKKSGACLLVAVAERLPKGRGYKLSFKPASKLIASAELPIALTAMNADIEKAIRVCPAQYQWSYKRFKTRPHASDQPFYFD